MSTGPVTCPTHGAPAESAAGVKKLRGGFALACGAWFAEVRATGQTCLGTNATTAILAACIASVPFFPRGTARRRWTA